MTVPSPPPLLDSSANYQIQQTQRGNQIFEFTKRKKWSNILLAEQPDTIIVVVDYDHQVQYVGPGMREVLGWEVEELIETDFLNIVNNDDKMGLGDRVKSCLASEKVSEMSCFTRLKCKHGSSFQASGAQPHKELLFEFRGRRLPDYDDSHEKLIILTAKPYPSRNTAILNTFLELTIENERLNERIASLKLEQQQLDAAASMMPRPSASNTSLNSNNFPTYPSFTNYGYLSAGDDTLPSQSPTSPKEVSSKDADAADVSVDVKEDDDGDGSKRKKSKKAPPGQTQYVCVTCGRTDSPEWRKGPKGPKTLCNACGLRWAKRAKRPDETARSSSGGKEGGYNPRGSSELGGRSGKIVPVAHAQLRVTPPDPPASSLRSTQTSSSATVSATQQQPPPPFPQPSPTHATFNHAGMSPYATTTGSIQYQLPIPNSMPPGTPSQTYLQSPRDAYNNSYGAYAWTHPEKAGENQYGY